MIWLVREEDSYVDIHYNFISYLSCVIATILFNLCNCYSSIYVDHLDEKLRKFNIFVSEDTCLYKYFGI
jgi:hypothetical protein